MAVITRLYIFAAVMGFLITAIILPRIAAILFFVTIMWTLGMVSAAFDTKDIDDEH